MRDRKVAVRYAEALLEAAQRQQKVMEVAESFDGLMESVKGRDDLRIFLEAPQVRTEEKKELLASVFEGRVEPLVLNFVELLLDKDRLFHTRDIHEEFTGLVEKAQGIQRARVVTAVPLPEDLADRLREKLAAMTGKTIVLEPRVDPAVIAGVSVTMGDEILDGTVRTGLEELRQQLDKAPLR